MAREFVQLRYQLNPEENLLVTVSLRSSYPDAVNEAGTNARRLMRESLREILLTTGREAFEVGDETSDAPAGVQEDEAT